MLTLDPAWCVVTLQRMWRRRQMIRALVKAARARYKQKKLEEMALEEEAKRRHVLLLKHRAKIAAQREAAAIKIQSFGRMILGLLVRERLLVHRQKTRVAIQLQAIFRGMSGRQKGAAARRMSETRNAARMRRRRVAWWLRLTGAKTRTSQQERRELLDAMGLDPDSFTLGLGAKAELMRDFREIRGVAQHMYRTVFTAGTNLRVRARLHDQWTEEQRIRKVPVRGDAVRIVLFDHPRRGETALVLNSDLSFGRHRSALKFDKDGHVEFLPILTAVEEHRAAELTMIRIPSRMFKGLPRNPSMEWRDDLTEWGAREALKRRRDHAARTIQRAARAMVAPVIAQRLKDKLAEDIARARGRWLKALRLFGLDKKLVGQKLVRMGVMKLMVRCRVCRVCGGDSSAAVALRLCVYVHRCAHLHTHTVPCHVATSTALRS